MRTSECLNCFTPLPDAGKFCATCGQARNIHRLTLPNFFHEVFHAFTHTDKGIFHLLKSLVTRPGTTAREYVLGRRKSYFNPFTFFLILMGIFVLSNNYFHKTPPNLPDPQVLKHIPTAEGRAHYVAIMKRVNTTNLVFRKHGNVVAMVAVPFLSFFTWIFFRRKRFNYAEHLTANMMFVAFSNLFFTLIIFPLAALLSARAAMTMTFAALLAQVLYFAWGLNGFLELDRTPQRVKSLAVSLLAIVAWVIFTLLLSAIYIYQSKDFYQYFIRMRA